MKNLSVVLGFAPWIAFGVLCGPSTWELGALTALLITVILAVPEWRRTREIGVLDAGSMAFFAVLAVLALVLDRAQLSWLEERAQLISTVVLFLIAGASLVLRRPFTEHYARQMTPREYWTSPLFHRINVVITTVWTLTFGVHALSQVAAVVWPGADGVFRWALPAVTLVAAIKFTTWYPDHASAPADARAGDHAAGAHSR